MHGSDAPKLDMDRMVDGVLAGDRVALGRAITLIESAKPEDQARAQSMLDRLNPRTGNAIRVGISGVPGAGKSTLIDQLGLNLIAKGHKVAVLAVDPTSTRSGGSILGDKTRMGRLATEPSAFIRPSPAGDSLGGVTKTTRETIALVEAAGYDLVLVETVGVGQSEIAVANMVDIFVVVAMPGRRRRAARHQAGAARACRHHRRQQGGRRQCKPRRARGSRLSRRAAHSCRRPS